MEEKFLRYKLIFNKMFFYSCKYRKNDRKEIIKKLKEKCLESIRASLKHLLELPDNCLLEILDKEVFEISKEEYSES